MKIEAHNLTGGDIRISLEAENEAEERQVDYLREHLEQKKVKWYDWDNRIDCGGRGIGIIAHIRS